MTKYTPGPWKVIKHNHSEGQLWLSVNQDTTTDGGYEWVAEIKYLTIDSERQWANARLIAAAPELLEALKLAWHYTHTNLTLKAKVEAAIAKSEGRINA